MALGHFSGRIESRRVRSLAGLAKFDCKVLPGSNEAEAKLDVAAFNVKTAGEAEDKAFDLKATAAQKAEDASVFKTAARNEATKVDIAMDQAKRASDAGDTVAAGKLAEQAAKLADNTVKLEAEASISTAISKAATDSSERLKAASDAMKAGDQKGAAAELKLGVTRATTGANAKISAETDKLVQKGAITVAKGEALATQVSRTMQASMQPSIAAASVAAASNKMSIPSPKGKSLNIAKGLKGLGGDFELVSEDPEQGTVEYVWKGVATGIDWASSAAKTLGVNLSDVVSWAERNVTGCDFPMAGDNRSKVLKEMYKGKYGMYPSNRAMAILNGNYADGGTRRYCSKAAMNNLLDGKPEIGLTAAPDQGEIQAFYSANGFLPPGLVRVASTQNPVINSQSNNSAINEQRRALIALAEKQAAANETLRLTQGSSMSPAMIIGGIALAGIVAYAVTRRR